MGIKIGTTIGSLKVVGKLGKDKVLAMCSCNCNVKSYYITDITNGLVRDCGCQQGEVVDFWSSKEKAVEPTVHELDTPRVERTESTIATPEKKVAHRKRRVESLVGKRFHNLVVTEELDENRVVAKCDCGEVREYTRAKLLSRKSSKCTCNRGRGIKGMRRGMLEVIEDISCRAVLVRCDCGNEKEYVRQWFEAGTTTDCGCIKRAKRIIKPGTRFNMLTVIEDTGASTVKARCDCGTVKDYVRCVLVNSGIKNCGCSRVLLDFVGRQFGDYTVIKELGHSKVLARCVCGTEKEFNKTYIQSGRVTDCGCKVGRKSYRSLVGMEFKRLVVIEELDNGKVLAKCSCNGNIKEYIRGNLISGATGSCGCLRSHVANGRLRTGRFIDRTGQKFGMLTIVKELGSRRVVARCDCGSTKEYNKNSLVNGDTKSCGCIRSKLKAISKQGGK